MKSFTLQETEKTIIVLIKVGRDGLPYFHKWIILLVLFLLKDYYIMV